MLQPHACLLFLCWGGESRVATSCMFAISLLGRGVACCNLMHVCYFFVGQGSRVLQPHACLLFLCWGGESRVATSCMFAISLLGRGVACCNLMHVCYFLVGEGSRVLQPHACLLFLCWGGESRVATSCMFAISLLGRGVACCNLMHVCYFFVGEWSRVLQPHACLLFLCWGGESRVATSCMFAISLLGRGVACCNLMHVCYFFVGDGSRVLQPHACLLFLCWGGESRVATSCMFAISLLGRGVACCNLMHVCYFFVGEGSRVLQPHACLLFLCWGGESRVATSYMFAISLLGRGVACCNLMHVCYFFVGEGSRVLQPHACLLFLCWGGQSRVATSCMFAISLLGRGSRVAISCMFAISLLGRGVACCNLMHVCYFFVGEGSRVLQPHACLLFLCWGGESRVATSCMFAISLLRRGVACCNLMHVCYFFVGEGSRVLQPHACLLFLCWAGESRVATSCMFAISLLGRGVACCNLMHVCYFFAGEGSRVLQPHACLLFLCWGGESRVATSCMFAISLLGRGVACCNLMHVCYFFVGEGSRVLQPHACLLFLCWGGESRVATSCMFAISLLGSGVACCNLMHVCYFFVGEGSRVLQPHACLLFPCWGGESRVATSCMFAISLLGMGVACCNLMHVCYFFVGEGSRVLQPHACLLFLCWGGESRVATSCMLTISLLGRGVACCNLMHVCYFFVGEGSRVLQPHTCLLFLCWGGESRVATSCMFAISLLGRGVACCNLMHVCYFFVGEGSRVLQPHACLLFLCWGGGRVLQSHACLLFLCWGGESRVATSCMFAISLLGRGVACCNLMHVCYFFVGEGSRVLQPHACLLFLCWGGESRVATSCMFAISLLGRGVACCNLMHVCYFFVGEGSRVLQPHACLLFLCWGGGRVLQPHACLLFLCWGGESRVATSCMFAISLLGRGVACCNLMHVCYFFVGEGSRVLQPHACLLFLCWGGESRVATSCMFAISLLRRGVACCNLMHVCYFFVGEGSRVLQPHACLLFLCWGGESRVATSCMFAISLLGRGVACCNLMHVCYFFAGEGSRVLQPHACLLFLCWGGESRVATSCMFAISLLGRGVACCNLMHVCYFFVGEGSRVLQPHACLLFLCWGGESRVATSCMFAISLLGSGVACCNLMHVCYFFVGEGSRVLQPHACLLFPCWGGESRVATSCMFAISLLGMGVACCNLMHVCYFFVGEGSRVLQPHACLLFLCWGGESRVATSCMFAISLLGRGVACCNLMHVCYFFVGEGSRVLQPHTCLLFLCWGGESRVATSCMFAISLLGRGVACCNLMHVCYFFVGEGSRVLQPHACLLFLCWGGGRVLQSHACLLFLCWGGESRVVTSCMFAISLLGRGVACCNLMHVCYFFVGEGSHVLQPHACLLFLCCGGESRVATSCMFAISLLGRGVACCNLMHVCYFFVGEGSRVLQPHACLLFLCWAGESRVATSCMFAISLLGRGVACCNLMHVCYFFAGEGSRVLQPHACLLFLCWGGESRVATSCMFAISLLGRGVACCNLMHVCYFFVGEGSRVLQPHACLLFLCWGVESRVATSCMFAISLLGRGVACCNLMHVCYFLVGEGSRVLQPHACLLFLCWGWESRVATSCMFAISLLGRGVACCNLMHVCYFFVGEGSRVLQPHACLLFLCWGGESRVATSCMFAISLLGRGVACCNLIHVCYFFVGEGSRVLQPHACLLFLCWGGESRVATSCMFAISLLGRGVACCNLMHVCYFFVGEGVACCNLMHVCYFFVGEGSRVLQPHACLLFLCWGGESHVVTSCMFAISLLGRGVACCNLMHVCFFFVGEGSHVLQPHACLLFLCCGGESRVATSCMFAISLLGRGVACCNLMHVCYFFVGEGSRVLQPHACLLFLCWGGESRVATSCMLEEGPADITETSPYKSDPRFPPNI